MKNFILTISTFLFSSSFLFGQHQLTELWVSDKSLPIPESVLYVPGKQELYVSLIEGDGMEKDGKGGIAILNMDGSLKSADWITGLNAPKGLALHNELLYIADIDEIVVVNVTLGKVIRKIPVPNSTFLNDVTVNDFGKVFVSDTRENKIFQLEKNVVSLYLDEVPSVNGLKFEEHYLYALAGKELWKIDDKRDHIVVAKDFEQGGDGLEPVGNGDFLVTCWPGLVYYVKADGSIEKLLDVQGQMNTADLGYHPEKKILYIPTFNNNSVIAYQLK
ncbi:SMP-30/gluconolactonase/LRE family protein [Sphingobacterium hungaricum]